MHKAVFLDRDGVIVVPHFREGRSFAVQFMEDFRLYPDALEALSLLKKAGFLLIVVTNQPDMGKGLVSPETMEEMNRFLFQFLPIDDIRVCPHVREDNCGCRKPNPGLLKEAAKEWGIDGSMSYMIGDRLSDMEAGQSLGCKTIFIDLDYTAEQKPQNVDFSCKTLLAASSWILGNL